MKEQLKAKRGLLLEERREQKSIIDEEVRKIFAPYVDKEKEIYINLRICFYIS